MICIRDGFARATAARKSFLAGKYRKKMCFFFQAEDGIRDYKVTGVQTCALPILQEAYRREGGVPARVVRGLPAPARIGSRQPGERGDDVERIARRHGLSLLYAPSDRKSVV